jgi:hypothetical protein
MENRNPDFFNELKEEVTSYISLRSDLFRITAYEKIAKVSSAIFSGLMMLILFFFVTVFGSIMLGFYFGQLTGSLTAGFGIVTGFYLLILIIIVVFRKQLFDKFIVNKMIEILCEDEHEQ